MPKISGLPFTLTTSDGTELLAVVQSGRTKRATINTLLSPSYVSVTQYGAVGDGVTDDTTAILAAINTGRDVYFPATTNYYKISAELTPLSDQTLFGEGRSSQIRQTTTLLNVIHATGKTAVVVRNLGVYAVGTYTNYNTGCGVLFEACSDCEAYGVTVQNHRGGGIVLYATNDSRVERCKFLNSPVTDLQDNSQCAFDIGVVYSSSRNTITRNFIQSGQGTGVQVQSVIDGDACDDNIVTHNTIRDSKAYGIIAYRNDQDGFPFTMSTKRTIVAHNNISNIRGTIQNLAVSNYSFGAGIYIQGAEDFNVNNNTVGATHAANPVVAETLAPGAIGVTNCTRGTVNNNVIYDAGWVGIEVTDPLSFGDTIGFTNVVGNTITNCVKNGIRVRDRARIRISGNNIDTTAASGIRVNNSVTGTKGDVVVTDNMVRNTTAGVANIEMDTCTAPLVADNVCDVSAIHGITFATCTSPILRNCEVRNHVNRGVQFASTCSGGTCTGVYVLGTGTSTEGIRFDALTYTEDNIVTGCTSLYAGTFNPQQSVVQGAGSGKATAVTLSGYHGRIQMDPASLAAGAIVNFTLTNSAITTSTRPTIQRLFTGTTNGYEIWVDSVGAGSCVISVKNITAGALAEAITLGLRVNSGT